MPKLFKYYDSHDIINSCGWTITKPIKGSLGNLSCNPFHLHIIETIISR